MFPQRVGRGQVSIGDTQGKKRFVFSDTDFVPAAADTLSAARGEPGARCCRVPGKSLLSDGTRGAGREGNATPATPHASCKN